MPLDFLYEVDSYPAAGGKKDALSLTIQGGGPVPNVLVGLKRLGYAVALITAVGDDLPGRLGTEELKQEGIDTGFLIWKRRGESDTAGGFVERGNGRRTIVLARKTRVSPRDINLSKLPLPQIIHLDGRDLEACTKLARWGRRVGAAICFDIGSIRNDVSPIFPFVDHLIVADSYALPFTNCRTARRAVEKLTDYCPGTVVVTEGTRGSIGREDGSWVRQPAYRVREADTTGAGDAFHTGYIHGWLCGYDLAERMRLGAAIAALKCTERGARAGAPTLRKVNVFLAHKRPTHA
jgi:sugar/nucleoside kinase (ribokinase family)